VHIKPELSIYPLEADEGFGQGVRRALLSGVSYEVLRSGRHKMARAGNKVKIRFMGYVGNIGGKKFDGGTTDFRLGCNEVLKGVDSGVKGMFIGERRRLWIPSRLAYGKAGHPPVIPANADLVFDVQLLSVDS